MPLIPIKEFYQVAKRHKLSLKLVNHSVIVVLRNAFYAAISRILIGIFKRIGKDGLRFGVLSKILGELFSLDPLKWAFLFASLSCFRLLKRIFGAVGKHLRITDKGSAALSGFLCAVPVVVMNRETRTELCLYALVRALYTFFSGHLLPRLPEPLKTFEHYDILVMCLSASQILYGFVFAPFSMPLSYQHFLRKAAMIDDRVVRGVAGLARYQITPELVELCMEKGYVLPQDPREHFRIGCFYTHPGKTCNEYLINFLLKNICQVGIPIYLPVKVLTVMAFQWKKLRNDPFRMVRKMFFSVFSSALFLALYSASPLRLTCFAAQGNVRGGLLFAVFCSLAGIAAFLEPKSRRMDLALYCLAYALRSFVMTQYRFGRIPYPRHAVVVFIYLVSVGFLFFEYDQMPDRLYSRMRFIFDKLFEKEKLFIQELKDYDDTEVSISI